MKNLHIDFETRSIVDLRKCGQYVYAVHPQTDLILGSYRFDNGPIQRFRRGDRCPPDIQTHVRSGGAVYAHNAAFERIIWREILTARYDWPLPDLEQFFCTAAMARAMGLPGDLDRLARVLHLAVNKDMTGHGLMLRMSRPRSKRNGKLVWWDECDPEKLERLHDYCDVDVQTESAAHKQLFILSPIERAIWLLDQQINDAGIRVDRHACLAALQIIEDAKKPLNAQLTELTGGYITAATQNARFIEWINMRGVPCTSIRADLLATMLAQSDLPDDVRQVLEIREKARRSSTAKIAAFLARTNDDNRMRGSYIYHGASTGRWSAKGAQLHNLVRTTGTVSDPPQAVRYIKMANADLLELLYGSPIAAVADCVRPMLVASKRHRLVARDYSNIEGRVTAWVANEYKKLAAFRDFDAGRGPDIYFIAASGIFGLDPLKMDKKIHYMERQVGKVSELALGFGGGVAAFASMAENYGVDVAMAYDHLVEQADERLLEITYENYEAACLRKDNSTIKLTEKAWIASELTKIFWRRANPSIVKLWALLEKAIREAMEQPGTIINMAKVKYLNRGGYLWCLLPSNRTLGYRAPQLEMVKTPWGEKKWAVTYAGINSQTSQWERYSLYGGLACENIVQAIARDILAEAMLRVKQYFPIVMHTHDEIVLDVPVKSIKIAEKTIEKSMCEIPAWATGLPISISGWSGFRYRKD